MHHVEFQVAMSHPRGNIIQADRHAGLDGREELWNGEVTLGTISIEVILNAQKFDEVI